MSVGVRTSIIAMAAVCALAGVPATSRAALVTPSGTPAPFVATVPASQGSCSNLTITVGLVPGLPKTAEIAGTLCEPAQWAAGPRTVDVLVHGGMYNRQYWDWPLHPELYSYVRRTVQAGRAAFYYDGLGVGSSTHPAGPRASFNADVYALHQVVQWLRSDYPALNTIGHSLGSAVVSAEAGEYNDSDHVVLTGLTHGHGLGFITLPANIYTALLDPQFAGMITLLDGGYLTTLPGKRSGLFYSSSADPAVISYDEAHKDVMTASQASQAIAALSVPAGLNLSNQITRPVLLIVGQQDAPFCNVDVSCANASVLRDHEAFYFTGTQNFSTMVVPGTGHDLPLHPSAGTSFEMISDWLEAG